MAKHLNPGLELIPLSLEPVIDQAGEDPYDVPPKASPTPQSEYHSTGGRVNFQSLSIRQWGAGRGDIPDQTGPPSIESVEVGYRAG